MVASAEGDAVAEGVLAAVADLAQVVRLEHRGVGYGAARPVGQEGAALVPVALEDGGAEVGGALAAGGGAVARGLGVVFLPGVGSPQVRQGLSRTRAATG